MSARLRERADYLLSKEKGTVFKPPGGKKTVCLIYPNTYRVGMSNLGFQGVYGMFNDRADFLCERAFLPEPEDIAEHERTGTEIFSLESKMPLSRFDIVAFSVPFENDYTNIPRILQLANIPPESALRGENHPLLAMGGVCAMSNPEPMAEFFDVIFIGEAEEMLPEFMDACAAVGSREALLNKTLEIEGIYVPRFYELKYGTNGLIAERTALGSAPATVRRRYASDISKGTLRHRITTPEAEFSDMCLVEAMRGCPWSCSFCLAGHVFNPPRSKGLEAIRSEIEHARPLTGRVGLVGPSLSDYTHAGDVLGMEGVDFSITSLRASRRSAELVGMMRNHKSVSMAPEAGTDRLRAAINKRITDADILETAGLIHSAGIRSLRLYFMVGLPFETESDIEAIPHLVEGIRDVFGKGRITITLSTFVPKPFTPFQWHPMSGMDVVKSRLNAIKKALKGRKGIGVFHDVPKYTFMQGMLARGDRRVARVLKSMLDTPDWRKAAAGAGIDPDFYIMRPRDFSEPLPWDFIDSGIPKEKLWEKAHL
jgi:radical SAM superfamily enzyme YgiQ (UPF0313 family)